MRHTNFRPALAIAAMLALSACGGGGEPSTSADPVLPQEQAWTGPLPETATTIAYDEFRAAVLAGRITLAGPAVDKAQAGVRARQFESDKAALMAAAADNPALRRLVEDAARSADPMGEPLLPATDSAPARALLGPASMLRLLAQHVAHSNNIEGLMASYAQSYSLAPAEVQAALRHPESMNGSSADALRAALADLEARLAAMPPDGSAQARAVGPWAALHSTEGSRQHALALQPGAGSDRDAADCRPTHLAANHWFAMRNFLSPARSQGMRSTCWAFAGVGALEIRERIVNNLSVNMSEQFLVNQTRHKWFPNDMVESGSAQSALNMAADVGQVIPDERVWTYNRSMSRDPSAPFIKDACIGYGTGADAGSCSETAHQSPLLKCAGSDQYRFCGYERIDYNGPGFPASKLWGMWSAGEPFPIQRIAALLKNGVPLVASMPIYPGLDSIEGSRSGGNRGVLTDTSTPVNGVRGSHVVLIVGFLDNATLSRPGRPVDIPGGGYFVVRNSWGCAWGDAGYAYISAEYVKNNFVALEWPNFDRTRSAAWAAEQALPGSQIAPVVAAKDGIVAADHNVSTDVAGFFQVSHETSRTVGVRITSNVEGVLYNGNWSTNTDQLINQVARHAFKVRGTQEVTLQARYGSHVAEVTVVVNVINNPPVLKLQGSGTAAQGEDYALTALVSDRNESDNVALCARTQWNVSSPDTLAGATGCSQVVRFGSTGPRTVTVTATDAEGLSVTERLTVDVQAPPPNPYPRIRSAELFARELVGVAPFRRCGAAPVANGQRIDLRERGCITFDNEPRPTLFGARVDVENPANEPLTYEWNLVVMHDGIEGNVYGGPVDPGGSIVSLGSPGNQSEVTYACRLELKVRAPQPERDKTRVAWNGQCTYVAGRLN